MQLRKQPLDYRPDIDGLRAIAVVMVAVFHADLTPFGIAIFPSGFFGVDVFFVLSGYLITSLVFRDVQAGQFSYWRFMERRVRRISPALLLVIAACVPVAWVLLSPLQMRDFSASAGAAALFVSNIWFWLQSGYFDQAAETKPLLHTWTLGVEMQFYLLFPLLLVWIGANRQKALSVICGLAVTSILACLVVSAQNIDLSFYMLPTRAWELLAGGIVALLPAFNAGGRRATLFVALGLLAIVVPSLFVLPYEAHPGLITMLPVAGTMLVIVFSRPGVGAAKLLGWKPFVFVGLLSYSFYLWHQPFLVFQRMLYPDGVPSLHKILCLIVAFLASWATWLVVEQPGRRTWPRRPLFAGMLAKVAALVTFGVMGSPNGYLARFGDNAVFSLDVERGFYADGRDCFHESCVIGDETKSPRIALKGDSHAGVLVSSLHASLFERGLSALTLADGDMLIREFPSFYQGAEEQNRLLVRHLQEIEDRDIDTVIYSARTTLRVMNEGFDNREGGVELTSRFQGGRSEAQIDEMLKRVSDQFTAMADAGIRFVLVYPIPEVGWSAPDEIAIRQTETSAERLTTLYEVYRERNARIIETYDALSEHPNIYPVRTEDLFCNIVTPGRCETLLDGELLYFDTDHLSRFGADILMERIAAVIDSLP